MRLFFAKSAALVAGVACFSLALCFAIMAWSDPGQTPPGGNVAAPINTGGNLQTKSGDLKIGTGLTISSNAPGTAFVLKANDGTHTGNQLVVGQDGHVGIGTTAPGEKLEVAGNTKATQFCLNGQCCANWAECVNLAGGCFPKVCAAGDDCGAVVNGTCGGTIDCGACVSPKTCQSNHCAISSCKPLYDSCVANSECCSENCNKRQCLPSCKSPGASCNASPECCSGVCFGTCL